MKADIHPNYSDIKVTCSCGNEFTTRSTLGEDLLIEVCSSCHPFYTGKQKIVDTGGRVDKFRRKYGMSLDRRLRPVPPGLLRFSTTLRIVVLCYARSV